MTHTVKVITVRLKMEMIIKMENERKPRCDEMTVGQRKVGRKKR
jgi:hypothetical protein